MSKQSWLRWRIVHLLDKLPGQCRTGLVSASLLVVILSVWP